MANKLQQAVALIKVGDISTGRRLLAEILQAEPKNETAWLWMSNVVASDEQRRHCLKQVLLINPHHPLAQKGLALLEQKCQKPSPLTSKPTAAPKDPLPQTQVKASPAPAISAEEPLKRPKGLNLPALEIPPEVTPVSAPARPAQPSAEIKRVWINPKAALKVVVLYDEAIAVASPDDKELNRLQAAPDRDTPPPELLGSNLKLFYFKEINSIKAVPEADSLHISYAKGQNIGLQRIPFASEEVLREFMQVLQAKLGPRFEQTIKKYSALEASVSPLILLGIITLATYFLYGAAVEAAAGTELEISGRRQLLKLVFAWLIMLLGPKGVLVVGILLAALLLFWLVARILNPPTRLLLTPAKNQPSAQTQAQATGLAVQASPARSIPASEKTPSKPAGLSDIQPPLASSPKEIAPSKQAVETAKPKKPGIWYLLLVSILVILILCVVGATGFLYMNLPPYNPANYPGLIEGGLIIQIREQGLTSDDLRALALHKYPQSELSTIDLSYNELTELPPEIGQFPHLKYLILKYNHLKRLPPEIGQLTDLEELDLTGNHLLSLPPEIVQLKNLKDLYLQGNPIRLIPPELEQKPDLRIHR